VFHPIDKTLNTISQPIDDLVEFAGPGFIDSARDRDSNMAVSKIFPNLITAVSLVPDQPMRSIFRAPLLLPLYSSGSHQFMKCNRLMPVPRSERKCNQLAVAIGSYVYLGGEPSLTVAERLFLRTPFFSPAAWWCARMIVLSIRWISQFTDPRASALAVRAENI